MCCFSQPVISVSNTQIFARPTARQTQFLVYQMNYKSQDENAMILPLPVRQPVREDSLRFIDLEDYSDFFDDLAVGFPFDRPSRGIGCAADDVKDAAAGLEVFEVGNYIASFVPGMADFSRLDTRFTLPQSTWDKIPQYRDFGFAVFQLAAGALSPHPMAFEFESVDDSIFFPTLHIHDGEIHEEEDFDHVLYSQHAGFDSRVYAYQNSFVLDQSTGLIRSKHVASQFCDIERSKGILEGNLLVHREIIKGTKPNHDIKIATAGDPLVASFNWRPWIPYTPWVVAGSAVAWFFSRRARIRRKKEAGNGKADS